jgi:DNA polymerase-1
LQFRVLRDRLYQTLEAAVPEADQGFDVDAVRLGPGALGPWLATHTGPDPVGVSVRGYWGRGTGEATEIAVATDGGAAAWFDPSAIDPADDAAFAGWLDDPDRPKVLHDAKGPLRAGGSRWTVRGWPATPRCPPRGVAGPAVP